MRRASRSVDAARLLLAALLVSSPLLACRAQASVDGAELAREWSRFLSEPSLHLPEQRRFPHQACFEAAALRHRLPATLLLAVARGESDFEAAAVSSANAVGVMQIRWPLTARHLGIDRRRQLFEPCTNIEAGARYLRELLERFDGDLHLALLAYHQGPSGLAADLDRRRTPHNLWYSRYVLDHLDFVVDRVADDAPLPAYSETGRFEIVVFGAPFHARSLASFLNDELAPLHFDWFKQEPGAYAVAFHFEDRQQHRSGLRALQRLGLVAR